MHIIQLCKPKTVYVKAHALTTTIPSTKTNQEEYKQTRSSISTITMTMISKMRTCKDSFCDRTKEASQFYEQKQKNGKRDRNGDLGRAHF